MSLTSYRKYRALGSHAYYARRRRLFRVFTVLVMLAVSVAIYSLFV